jgi:RHS repeat-associated protein
MAAISDKALKTNYAENRYKYNQGTELQNKEFGDGSGLELYETSFRSYDPQIGRFHQHDPLSDQGSDYSPYAYGLNNPVLLNDPSGLFTEQDASRVLESLWNTENGGEWNASGGGGGPGTERIFDSQDDAIGSGLSEAYISGYLGSGTDRDNNFNAIAQRYNDVTGETVRFNLPVLDVGYRTNSQTWVNTNADDLQNQLARNGANFGAFINNYANPFLEETSFGRNVGMIGVIPWTAGKYIYEDAVKEAGGIANVAQAELKSLSVIKVIGSVADIAGKLLGGVNAVEHTVTAIKDIENGNYGKAALNLGKAALDITFALVKASPVGLVLSLGYAVFDLWSSDDN